MKYAEQTKKFLKTLGGDRRSLKGRTYIIEAVEIIGAAKEAGKLQPLAMMTEVYAPIAAKYPPATVGSVERGIRHYITSISRTESGAQMLRYHFGASLNSHSSVYNKEFICYVAEYVFSMPRTVGDTVDTPVAPRISEDERINININVLSEFSDLELYEEMFRRGCFKNTRGGTNE